MTDEPSTDWKGYGIDQAVVEQWVRTRFGDKVFEDVDERLNRAFEEMVELKQSEARDKVKARADAHKIVDRVFDRPAGDPAQEAGGVIVTLLAYCALRGARFDKLAGVEITRIMKTDPAVFRKKQGEKADLGIAMRPE